MHNNKIRIMKNEFDLIEQRFNDVIDSINKSESKKLHEKIKKTKVSLSKALISLLNQKPLSEIDVSELCTVAKINRTTFYNHYKSISDLLDDMISQFFRKVKTYFDENKINQGNTTYKVSVFLNYLQMNRQFVLIAMNNDLFEKIKNKLLSFDFVSSLLNTNISYKKNEFIDEEYYISFIIGGWYATIKRWINQGCDVDVNRMARILTSIY